MAVKTIETKIAVAGEQTFKRAMADATREIRVQESALRALSAAYDNNGDKQSFLTGKQNVLKEQISQQEQIVKALEDRLKKYKADPNSSERSIQELTIQYNSATAKLEKYKKALNQAEKETEELGRDSTKAGRQIAEGIGEGAEDAEENVKSLMETMRDSLTDIQASATFQTVQSVWGMATDAWGQVTGFVDETREYRRQLSLLELSASQNNFDLSAIEQQMISIASVTGNATGAMEGLINLMNTGMSDYQLQRAVDLIKGATLEFPGLSFEQIAEGLQETLATGQASGSFLEVIERLGGDVEAFNTAMESSKTLAGDVEVALAELAAGGLKDTADEYERANEALTKAQATKAELELELGKFAEKLEQYVTQPIEKAFVDGLKSVNNLIATAEEEGVDAALALAERKAEAGAQAEAEVRMDAFSGMPAWLQTILKSGGFATSYINWAEGAAESAGAAGESAGEEYAQGFVNGLKTELDLTQVVPQEATQIQPFVDWKSTLEEQKSELEATGEEAGEALVEGLETGAVAGGVAAQNAGAEFGRSYAQGIFSQVSYVASAAGALAAAAASRLSTGGGGIVPGALFGGILNIDGRQAGTFLAPFVAEQIAVVQ